MFPLLRGVLLAAIICVLSESEAKPGMVRYCTTNDDCDLGFYCFASYDPPICSPCIDCSRARKKNPANGCAQHSDECGPCVDGYTAQGIRCLEDEVPGLTQTLDSAVTEGGSDSLFIITIVFLSAGFVIVLLVCLFYYKRWRRLESVRRQCPKSFGGEIPQTSASEECIGLASAPPATELEYDRQDPYNRNFTLNPVLPPQRFMTDRVRLINDQRQQADPFSAGNSYGQNTIDYMNDNQQPNADEEDELDGDAEDVIAALLDIEMDEPGVQFVNPELPLAEVSISLENMHNEGEEPMDFDEDDGLVPRVGHELEDGEDGNANDSGFSNSTSTSGLDQIVPTHTKRPEIYHMQILRDFFDTRHSTLPLQQPAQGDASLPNLLPNVEEFQGGILQNVNQAELVVVFSEENFGQIVNDSGLSLSEDSYAHETSLNFENIGDD